MKYLLHTAYVRAREQLQLALDSYRPGHMVFLIGPSGAGKTTMRHSVLREKFGNPEHWGRGRIPIAEVFAVLPSNAYYSSRATAKGLLEELHAPRLKWLLDDSDLPPDQVLEQQRNLAKNAEVWEQLRPRRGTESDHWAYVQRSLIARHCKYVSIDQVTALLVNHRDTTPADHTLHLMALAEATGTMFIMTGVYQATRLWAVHSELRRRVVTVWVPPYSHRRPEDREPFMRLLASLSLRYTLSKPDLLIKMWAELLAATGGVFQEIELLLDRAMRKVRAEGATRIAKQHIVASYYSDYELKTLWHDIDAFEETMRAGNVSERAALIKSSWKPSPSVEA